MKINKMNIYNVILDYDDPISVIVPAKSEKDAREYVDGNGEIVAIKDVTEQYPISGNKVMTALENAGFGEKEQDVIRRALDFCGLLNWNI